MYGTFKKNVILITIFVAFMLIEIIIYFDEGLNLTAIWCIVAVILGLTLIAMIHQNNLRSDTPSHTLNATDITQSYPDISPPSYYSVVLQPNKQMPPQYQSVELIPVSTYHYPNQMQRY